MRHVSAFISVAVIWLSPLLIGWTRAVCEWRSAIGISSSQGWPPEVVTVLGESSVCPACHITSDFGCTVENWSCAEDEAGNFVDSPVCIVQTVGWPFRCLRMVFFEDRRVEPRVDRDGDISWKTFEFCSVRVWLPGAVCSPTWDNLSNLNKWTTLRPCRLPTKVLASGYCLNVLIAGGAWLGLRRTFRWWRGLRRRGRWDECSKCGYLRGSLRVCPECGAQSSGEAPPLDRKTLYFMSVR